MKKALIGAGLALAALGTEELYRYVFCRDQGKLLPPLLDKKKHDEDYYIHREACEARVRAYPCRRCTISSGRGKPLAGYYYCCGERPCGRIAFIVHGYRSNHGETAGIHFDYYMSRGFDVFAPDNAAHGDSGGRLISYGIFEGEDCLRWLDFLRREYGEDVKIVLHGYSMGAASVLRISDRVPANVKFIVEDSGFDCAGSILKNSLSLMYGPLMLINRAVAGVDIKGDRQIYASLARASVPILFVHGRKDNMVPFAMGQRLYEAYSGEKDCLFTDDAAHIETMLRAGEQYAEKLDEFIERYVGGLRGESEEPRDGVKGLSASVKNKVRNRVGIP